MIVPLMMFLALCLTIPAWANVPYTLEGILTLREDVVTLNTADGRVFALEMDRGKAKGLDGEHVRVEGLAKQADDLSTLQVKKISKTDPQAPELVLPPFKSYQRPAKMISSTRDAIVMGDVRWSSKPGPNGKSPRYFWENVTIRPELVDKIYFVKKPFPPEWIAAHSLMLFTFKPGGLVDSKGQNARGLCLTIEAYQRVGQNYSLQAGLKKTFKCVWMLTTWEDYLANACDLSNSKLYCYRVKFDPAQNQALLRESLKQAAVNREGEYYHTITNNCTNTLVILINHVLEKKIKLWLIPSLIYNMKATMPVWVPKFLIKKGILDQPLPEINKRNYFVDLEKIH